MKKIAFIIGLIIAGILSVFSQNDNSDNRITTETRETGSFDKIEIRGRFDVKLTQQKNTSLSVAAQKKFLEYIETTVEDGTLIVRMKEPQGDANFVDKIKAKYSDYFNRQLFEITIGVNNLKEIKMSGASILNTQNNFVFTDINFDISGASKLQANCAFERSNIDISGASSVHIEGKGRDVSLDVSGASSYKGSNMKCEKVIADISGASNAEVYATDDFIGNASGASAILCLGNPKKTQRDISGASKITIE